MKKIILTVSLLIIMILLAACSGPQGEPGPMGPPGPPGPEGPQGPEAVVQEGAGGEESSEIQPAPQNDYIGDTTCQGCHSDIYNTYIQSGHPWIFNRIEDGQEPDLPFTSISKRPAGYDWEDFLYIVGGYNWKAHFGNSDGFIITNPPDTIDDTAFANQFNLPNLTMANDAAMVPFHAGEENKPYDCGRCHTTGYNPIITNERPGIVGTWAQEGVRCENCHGPGSLHASDPTRTDMRIERDGGACESCHPMSGVPAEAIGNGFIVHGDAYGDLFPGKHALLDCVDCHDPHTGVVALRKSEQPTTRARCVDCHFEYANLHKVPEHAAMNLGCTDCHMPRIIQVAWAEPSLFTADMRTHQVIINPDQLGQFTEDGSEILPQVGLNYACRRCHLPNTSIERTDEELLNAAENYHSRSDAASPEAAEPAATAAP